MNSSDKRSHGQMIPKKMWTGIILISPERSSLFFESTIPFPNMLFMDARSLLFMTF